VSSKKITIAIDGHSSCGKSTVAKQVASELNYSYVDTGAMYRCVTFFAFNENLIENKQINENQLISRLYEIEIDFRYNSEIGKNETYLNGTCVETEIRGLKISEMVSPIAKIKEVRQYLVKLQQEMGKNGGVVMDGRDIGTVVLPNAELKIFMTATPEVRALRRYNELKGTKEEVSFEEILENVKERDFIDSTRKESPLKMAEGAILLDNSTISHEEQLAWILAKVNELF